MNNIYKLFYLLAVIVPVFSGCGERPKDVERVPGAAPIFPDYVGVTVPQGIAPLNFAVNDDNVEKMDVAVKGSKWGELHARGRYADFDIDDWHELLEKNGGGDLTVTVCVKADGGWKQYDDFKIMVSDAPIGEWGLTYRRIAPGYEVYSKMGIYQRDLSNFKEYAIIENTMTDGQCYNCHTSNRTNPRQTVFHIRGSHGGTMISKDGKCTLLAANNDELGGSMVYPYWHPGGRYCAFSTNQTRQGFHISGDKRLEVFDLSSDLLVYDTEKNEILTDTLLNSKKWSENSPSFSPDGKWLYFTTCLQQEYPQGAKDERYNLCRIAFDADKGSFGEKVDTLFNAAEAGKSVSWPRPSYDGKYVLFTLSDYGYFSIWHKESDQWLLDTSTGEARRLDEINSGEADSFHNWSGDSRWIVFTSRRQDGHYSHLYLAKIDDNGRFSKPVMLPQKNPLEYYGESLYSFNTPDFVKEKTDLDSQEIVRKVMSDQRTTAKMKK